MLNRLKWPPRVTINPPELKRGEYVWKAQVIRHKLVPTELDEVIHTELFKYERQAIAFKRSIKEGISQNTVLIDKLPIADEEGWIAHL